MRASLARHAAASSCSRILCIIGGILMLIYRLTKEKVMQYKAEIEARK